MSRLVGYTLRGAFCERDVEDYLARAKAAGVVVDFGAYAYDDSGVVWFNGMPGPGLRVVREAVAALVTKGPRCWCKRYARECPGHGRRA
jgi:hypothetical protein